MHWLTDWLSDWQMDRFSNLKASFMTILYILYTRTQIWHILCLFEKKKLLTVPECILIYDIYIAASCLRAA